MDNVKALAKFGPYLSIVAEAELSQGQLVVLTASLGYALEEATDSDLDTFKQVVTQVKEAPAL